MAELPHLLQLQEKHTDEVVAITWSLDHSDAESQPSEALQKSVVDKLVSLNMRCVNVICSDSTDEVYKHLDMYAPPVVLVYGRDGTLARKFGFDGLFSYEKDVSPFVESLLQ